MTIEEMRERKKELGLSNKELAARSGVPLGTVQRILSGETRSPRMQAVLGLEKVLKKQDPDVYERTFGKTAEEIMDFLQSGGEIPAFEETRVSYGSAARRAKKQGEYTLEDYYALPEDQRVELIDGVFYEMLAPSYVHQRISMEVSFQLHMFVQNNHGKCRVFTAPFDVQLDCDDRTMVEPDVLVICNESRKRRFGCFGAPDLVMEILSSSTSKKDLTIKLHKYMNAGVKEYWIINPKEKQVLVYENQDQELSFRSWNFSEKIPVGIWEGRCTVDLSGLIEEIEEMEQMEVEDGRNL